MFSLYSWQKRFFELEKWIILLVMGRYTSINRNDINTHRQWSWLSNLLVLGEIYILAQMFLTLCKNRFLWIFSAPFSAFFKESVVMHFLSLPLSHAHTHTRMYTRGRKWKQIIKLRLAYLVHRRNQIDCILSAWCYDFKNIMKSAMCSVFYNIIRYV